jgi:hypothetical protein
VAVNLADTREATEKYVREGAFPFKIALGKEQGDRETGIFKQYRVDTYPSNFLIDSSGKIVFRSVGFDEQGLRAALAKMGIGSP